jgi:hypothetical protein
MSTRQKVILTLIFSILILNSQFFILNSSAREYYVSNSGNDSNTGSSPAQAWKTLDKVNKSAFIGGDIIKFECEGIWRGQLVPVSGKEEKYITYTSYGSGAKPLFLGSQEKNNESDWKNEGDNIWSTGKFNIDVGNIIFDNGKQCGIKMWNKKDLDFQNEFWYDKENKNLLLYSVDNPAKIYKDIECALTDHIINQWGKSYIIYDGLHLAYGAAHGVGGGDTHHIIVRNCDISFIGGGCQYGTVRYGNGIEFWSGAHDNTVENCRIWDIYDAGLTNQGNSKNSQYNIYYKNNVIWNCDYSFEYWNGPETSETHDIYFENNLVLNAGYGWSNKESQRGYDLMLYPNKAKTYNFFIRNNIFLNAKRSYMIIMSKDWNGLDNLVIDNNYIFNRTGSAMIYWGGWRRKTAKLYSCYDFEQYKKDTGKDKNSKMLVLDKLTLEFKKIELSLNESKQLKVKADFLDNISVDVTGFCDYYSYDPSIVSVNNGGKIKTLKTGNMQISINYCDTITEVNVIVK